MIDRMSDDVKLTDDEKKLLNLVLQFAREWSYGFDYEDMCATRDAVINHYRAAKQQTSTETKADLSPVERINQAESLLQRIVCCDLRSDLGWTRAREMIIKALTNSGKQK